MVTIINMEVGVRQAKAEMSKLIEAVLNGQRVVITNHGRALVELVPVRPEPKDSSRAYGSMKGILAKLPPDWDSPQAKSKVTALFETLE